MKKILLMAIALVLFAGCAKTPYTVLSKTVDYSSYCKDGFFITESNSVGFDYEPVGKVVVRISSGYEVLGAENAGRNRSRSHYVKYSKHPKLVTEKDVLDQIRRECEEMGGNGIINLSISYSVITTKKNVISNTPMETADIITVSGMAIKK